MPGEEPRWWYAEHASSLGRLLGPIGSVVGWVAERRWHSTDGYRAKLPVICIGNFTAGGTGKTPLALDVARTLKHAGETPVFLSRGYGGSRRGPHQVDLAKDTAAEVGDEVLLLAMRDIAFVARDRAAGAKAIEVAIERGDCAGTVIIMDDGLQNPSLVKDFTLAVVDGGRVFGNGRIIPAGPLRARLNFQMKLVDAIVVNQPPSTLRDGADRPALMRNFAGPILQATPAPVGQHAWLTPEPLVAFAGIGNPARFYELLRNLGGHVVEEVSFADHRSLNESEATRILELAASHGAVIATTEKDIARLRGLGGARGRLREDAHALLIRLNWRDEDGAHLASLLSDALQRRRQL